MIVAAASWPATWANIKFRLQGSTDEGTEELRERILDAIAGQRVVDLAAARARRCSPASCRCSTPRCCRRPTTHQDAGRPAYIVTAASQELAEMLAHVLVLDGGIGMRSEVRDGVYTGQPGGPFTYREGKAEAIRELAGPRASTSPSPTPTRTPSPTCRCCAPWATRWR